ncbi:hypothetical protein HH1059_10210 [Halorhodospira halochloris]|uniref:Uncharacterized protein n=1 Tax=Halorhodospira halochloris TaxID=1052 RepID=A0A2Z6EZF2_HALHR|nr:hypothetical protein HH1059_10210 [Halorhodospira halochloris]
MIEELATATALTKLMAVENKAAGAGIAPYIVLWIYPATHGDSLYIATTITSAAFGGLITMKLQGVEAQFIKGDLDITGTGVDEQSDNRDKGWYLCHYLPRLA